MNPAVIDRHRTAILRRKLSKPVQLMLDDGILAEGISFFDYGCGRGEDVAFLRKLGIESQGFDPYYAPDTPRTGAEIVNLGFVLNVIEDPEERRVVLLDAYNLAQDLLCVSVISPDPSALLNQPFRDGYITTWNTFQKYFDQTELFSLVESVTGVSPASASSGIVYVFKTGRFRESFLGARITRRSSEISARLREEENQSLIQDFLARFHELGRPPARAEFPGYARVVRLFGSPAAIVDSLRAEINEDTVRENAARRRNAVIVSICRAMIRKNGVPKLSELDQDVALDAKLFFGSFDAALRESRAHLQSLSDLSTVSKHINETRVGKILPDDLYVHVDSLPYIPDPLQILVELARMILPADVPYNVLKIARNSWHVTFLDYPDFHEHPHPALRGSMKVLLHKNQLFYRDYRDTENPPILHRKELFLHSEHPRFAEYSQLSLAEEEAGLLGRRDIGNRKSWEQALRVAGLHLDGHMLQRV